MVTTTSMRLSDDGGLHGSQMQMSQSNTMRVLKLKSDDIRNAN